MLDEGLNEYWDDRMLRERKQDIHLTSPFLSWFGFAPSAAPFVMERISGVVGIGQPTDSLDANSWDRMSNQSYGSVYARTASTMHDLEERLGKDVTERAFKAYYERWKFRHPSAADLRQSLAEASGKPDVVNDVFAHQVYGVHKVDDRVVDIDSEELVPQTGTRVQDGKRVELTDKQVSEQIDKARKDWKEKHKDAKPGTGPYPWRTTVTVRRDGAPVPQTLVVKFADGSSETVQWNDGSHWKRYSWDKPAKAVSAELDPDRKILLDADKLNDSRTVEADGSASRRWAADAAALLETFYTILVTL
jgi:hypothetical protein